MCDKRRENKKEREKGEWVGKDRGVYVGMKMYGEESRRVGKRRKMYVSRKV